jgi:hypothetical protein
MPKKHSDTERIGGPGASHENRRHPEKSHPRGENPREGKDPHLSDVSGGGGEKDAHHTHDPARKGGM